LEIAGPGRGEGVREGDEDALHLCRACLWIFRAFVVNRKGFVVEMKGLFVESWSGVDDRVVISIATFREFVAFLQCMVRESCCHVWMIES